jgi:hypothetical protein
MLDPKVCEVLENEWVQQKRDVTGQETWGYEIKPGAPDDVVAAFNEFLEAQATLEEIEGWHEKQ